MTWMRESKVFFWWCSGMISVSSMYSLCANLTKALMQWMYESISTSRTSSFPDRGNGVKRFKQQETMLTTKTADEPQRVEIHRSSSPGHSKSVCVVVKVSVDLKVCVVIQVCVSGVFRNEGVCVWTKVRVSRWRCASGVNPPPVPCTHLGRPRTSRSGRRTGVWPEGHDRNLVSGEGGEVGGA